MLKRGMPPVHPGEILKEMYLDPMGITVTEFAKGLKVARRTISLIINGHSGISAEMALRLSKAFGSSADYWLNLQRSYDLWYASQKISLNGIKHWAAAKKATGISKRA